MIDPTQLTSAGEFLTIHVCASNYDYSVVDVTPVNIILIVTPSNPLPPDKLRCFAADESSSNGVCQNCVSVNVDTINFAHLSSEEILSEVYLIDGDQPYFWFDPLKINTYDN